MLEIAGQVFGEKGFERTTGKEICEQAGVNTAAINYYFGGIEGLYSAVLKEARRRLVPLESVMAAVEGKPHARAKLEAILSLIVGAITTPGPASWAVRVLGRELIAAQAAEAFQEEGLVRSSILRGVVGELMGLAPDHPAVSRACVSVVGPCMLLLVADRKMLRVLFPALGLAPQDAESLHGHLVAFALGGIAEAARRIPK